MTIAILQVIILKYPIWSGRWGSNPRPSAWQAEALPLSYASINHKGEGLVESISHYPFYTRCEQLHVQPLSSWSG